MVKLFVEGGGDAPTLKSACRHGFTTFITKAGLKKRPKVVACGSRRDAFESFCTAVKQGEDAMLLVDSEAPVAAIHQSGQPNTWLPWGHLLQRDNWTKPANSSDTDCHLMVQVTESWFLADRDCLAHFFGQSFKSNQLPAVANPLEGIAKLAVYDALGRATAHCKPKGEYGKGEHSFKLLALIDPNKVAASSPWVKRFIDELKLKMV